MLGAIVALMHLKIVMNISNLGVGFPRVRIKGIQISEGPLYCFNVNREQGLVFYIEMTHASTGPRNVVPLNSGVTL